MLIVVSAPSGAGKSTLCERLLERYPGMAYSVSCTTREPRGDEVDGREYRFLAPARFQRFVEEGRFLEYAVVHGHRYGTLRATVLAAMAASRHVLLDIDVQGAAQIRERLRGADDADALKSGLTDIFIAPPSIETLRDRLEKRGTDTQPVIERRLANAREEMKRAGEFKYRVVNDRLEAALARLVEIVEKESRQHV